MSDSIPTKVVPTPPRPRTISELAKMSKAQLMTLAAQHGIKTAATQNVIPPNSNSNFIAASIQDDSDDEEEMSSTVRIDHNYIAKDPALEEKVNTELSTDFKIYQEKKTRRIESYKRRIDIENDLIEFCDHQTKRLKTEITEMKKKVGDKPGQLDGKLFLWEFD